MSALIDFQTAQNLVARYLAKMDPGVYEFESAMLDHRNRHVLHLTVSRVIEYDFRWVFFYDVKEFLETPDAAHVLCGNAPLIVDKNDARLYLTGTAHPVEFYVDQYRKGIKIRA